MKPATPARNPGASFWPWAILLAAGSWAACTGGADSDSTARNPAFDTDGDGISNAVEAEPLNVQLYHFDTVLPFDLDPSLAQGCPGSANPFCTGAAYNAINLPDADRANGYYHYYQPYDSPNTNDWGTLTLIKTLESTSRIWNNTLHYCWSYRRNRGVWAPKFGAGDLSQGSLAAAPYMGGPWYNNQGLPRHSHSHQNGLDLDIRYLRLNGDTIPLNLASPDSVFYDLDATVDLGSCFMAAGNIQYIFIDTIYAHISRRGFESIVVHDTSHRNHFHVRIRDPDGPNN
jgi:hypothetical protein